MLYEMIEEIREEYIKKWFELAKEKIYGHV